MESTSRSLINPLLGWSQGHILIVNSEGDRHVSTVNLQGITDVVSYENVPTTLRRAPSVIGGNSDAANGIITETLPFNYERALSVDEFKNRIRALIDY